MVISDFTFTRIPQTIFGSGKFNELAKIISQIGQTALIVTGANSLKNSGKLDSFLDDLKKQSIHSSIVSVAGEPSPQIVDDTVNLYRNKTIEIVAAIGGGGVIDAGKAISAMLPQTDSVFDYLEGVGNKLHDGRKIPFVAVPTTAGTGSECTKNAVLSQIGKNGFKKSLRHNNFVPEFALIDPQLSLTCPADITAACGMDAFTQLLESYVSLKASPMTNSLAYSGISLLKDNLVPACTNGSFDINVRGAMAYASYISGITLANAGLGIVHGLASTIGGYFKIPHGVICGTLVGSATRMNIELLREQEQNGHPALKKYAEIGQLLSGSKNENTIKNCNLLLEIIENWTNSLSLPLLRNYEITETDFEKIVNSTGIKDNPVQLNNNQIKKILKERI